MVRGVVFEPNRENLGRLVANAQRELVDRSSPQRRGELSL